MTVVPRENVSEHAGAHLGEFFQRVHGALDIQSLIRSAAGFFQTHGGDSSIGPREWEGYLEAFSSALARLRPEGDSFLPAPRIPESQGATPDPLRIAMAFLRENERFFRSMCESTSETFWLADLGPRMRIVYIAPSCKNLLGVAPEEICLTPRKWFSIVHRADRQRVWEFYKKIQDGRLESHEYRILHPDGSIRWVRNEGWPVRKESGEAVGMNGVIQDVTDRQRLKEELIQISEHEQRHLLEEIKDGICQHLAGTSLVCKVLYNKMVARNDPIAQDVARICTLLTTAVAEARQLSESLGAVNTGEGGLAAALARLAYRISSLFSISCVFRCGEDVAVTDEITATHLYGIAKEAVNNAIRSGGAVKIHIRLRRREERIVLTISDNGTGFEEPSGKNAGIGLRMMGYRATESGGQLSVERGKRGGTVVTCTVPACL
ncbi:MAG: PAS domain-containing protein [Chthoniobacteraceae bacterium]